MKKYIILLLFAFLALSCAKDENPSLLRIQASIVRDGSRVSYTEKEASGIVALEQEWEIGDKIIGYWGDNLFEYEISSVDGGIAELIWSKGYKLKGTELNVTMYYAPGCEYTDVKTLNVDYSAQDVNGKMPCTLTAVGSFSSGSLMMNFNCVAAVLAIRGIEGFANGETITRLEITGTKTSITVTNGVDGWTADRWGVVTDTIMVALPRNYDVSTIAVRAVTGERTVKILEFSTAVEAGKYYYTRLEPNVAAVEDGKVECFKTIEEAVAAVNSSSASEVTLTLLDDCSSAGILEINYSGSKKVNLDLYGNTLLLPGKGHFVSIGNGADVTVVSSLDGGFISQTKTGTGVSVNANYAIKCTGKLALNGGTVTTPTTSSYATSVYVNGGGSITVDGGGIEGARCLWVENQGSSAEIKSGVLSSTYEGNGTDRNSAFAIAARDTARLTISGGTILASYEGTKQDSGQVAVYLYSGTVTNISGGHIEAESDNAIFATRNSGDAFPSFTITGGTFISNGTVEGRTAAIYPYSVKSGACSITPGAGKTVILKSKNGPALEVRSSSYSRITLNGGYYSGSGSAGVLVKGASGTLTVNGGYFSASVSSLVASGHTETTEGGPWYNGTGDGISYGYKVQ